jgi:hypothetical protein
MLAMALLLHGGLLGGVGGGAAGVDGSGEGAWTLATPAEGFLAASGTGELAHLLHLCLCRAYQPFRSFIGAKNAYTFVRKSQIWRLTSGVALILEY